MEQKTNTKVCVTGGTGYIGSSLVYKLLNKGYTVHATLRNLEDESKVGVLKSFPGAEERLKLFQADIYKPQDFEHAIQGCEFVFHVATPTTNSDGSPCKNSIEATVGAVKEIGRACLKSGTVKKLIYTSSMVAVSALKEDGSGFKDFVDETTCTNVPLNSPYIKYLKDYVEAKLLGEKEALNLEKEGLEVVTLGFGVVGGNAKHLPYTPSSVKILLSMITQEGLTPLETFFNAILYDGIKLLEALLGKVPIVHIEDAVEAHLFSMETSSINGRVFCASSFVSIAEIGTYYQQNYPEFKVIPECLNGPKNEVKWGSRKLVEKGFVYKYGMKEILDDCVTCARLNAHSLAKMI